MKLLNCLECHDIVSLYLDKDRNCKCGKSSGKYTDLSTVEYSGPARILHISNEDYLKAKPVINTSYSWHVAIEGSKIKKVERKDSVNNIIYDMLQAKKKEKK